MAATVAVGVTACEGLNPTPGPTIFAGVIAGATESGSLTLEGGGSPLIAILKVTAPTSSSHTLNAVYDATTQQLMVAGEGYAFAGTSTSGTIVGSYNGPNGPGAFVLQAPAATASVQSFCGTYTTPGAAGILNLVVNVSTVIGVTVTGTGRVTLLSGMFSANSVTIENPDNSSPPLATGTLSGTLFGGAYDDSKGNRGTWRAAPC